MKLKSTLTRWTLALLFSICVFNASPASAQYCDPTFAFGCSLWGSQAITLGSLNWVLGSNPCTTSDYTWMSVNLTTGFPHSMSVTNNDWCGCAVWIDLNQNFVFDASENMFYSYSGSQVSTYNFTVTIPNGTPVGSYRMRVISPWGSDGFTTTNGNGQGPCGGYQYGGFQDFTIAVTGPQGIEDMPGNKSHYMSASLNGEANRITVILNRPVADHATLQLMDVSGRVIETRKAGSEKEILDVSALSSGVYFLNYFDGVHKQNIKLSK